MRSTQLCLFAVLAFISSPTAVVAAGKSVKVCNFTGNMIKVAVGWLDYGFPVATGFYAVPFETCLRILVPKADTYLPVFAYATGAEGKEYRPAGPRNNFCISRVEAFEEKSTAICQTKDQLAKQVVSDWEQFNSLGVPFAEAYQWDVR